jgi:16S rRNA (cytosine967-C5)-methyltransferase
VLRRRRALDELLDSTTELATLEERDRALARALVGTVLRRLGTLRHLLWPLLERGLPPQAPRVETALLLGAAQILFLDVPDHAAVDLSVRLVQADRYAARYAGLANAVLRRLARDGKAALTPLDMPMLDTPDWLMARWTAAYGGEPAHAIAAANGVEPALDLTVKSDPEIWAAKLDGRVLPTGSVRTIAHGAVTALPGFAEGAWWVQDAAAALPARLLGAGPGMRVADLCAAPGGKSAELAVTGARVTAVDRSAERLKRLAANFERLRIEAEIVVANALTFEAPPFDATLLDAPCTATGTIRRHPDVAWIKRQGDLAPLVDLQSRLIDRAIALTKPGGLIVYCTCSLEPEEGEGQIAALLRRNPDVKRVPIEAAEIGGLTECVNAVGELRTLPSHMQGASPRQSGLDGFFAARLQRKP